MALAGRLASLVSKIPGKGTGIYHDLGGAALGAGLTTLGNVATGQADEKPAARLIAEALGGGLAGYGVAKSMRPIREASINNLRAASATGILKTPIGGIPVNPQTAQKAVQVTGPAMRALNLGQITAYGGLGGLVGGGVANVLQVPQTHEPDIDGSVEQYLQAIQSSDPQVLS